MSRSVPTINPKLPQWRQMRYILDHVYGFKVGEVVSCASDEYPLMCVHSIKSDDMIQCVWFDPSDTLNTDIFHGGTLYPERP